VIERPPTAYLALKGVERGDWTKPSQTTVHRLGAQPRPERVGVTDHPRLSPSLREILGLISSGYSNSEIGMFRRTSEETVRTQVKQILSLMGARTRAHAVTRGFQLGLLTIDSLEPSFAPSSESPYE